MFKVFMDIVSKQSKDRAYNSNPGICISTAGMLTTS
jgi:hypothetical protein